MLHSRSLLLFYAEQYLYTSSNLSLPHSPHLLLPSNCKFVFCICDCVVCWKEAFGVEFSFSQIMDSDQTGRRIGHWTWRHVSASSFPVYQSSTLRGSWLSPSSSSLSIYQLPRLIPSQLSPPIPDFEAPHLPEEFQMLAGVCIWTKAWGSVYPREDSCCVFVCVYFN